MEVSTLDYFKIYYLLVLFSLYPPRRSAPFAHHHHHSTSSSSPSPIPMFISLYHSLPDYTFIVAAIGAQEKKNITKVLEDAERRTKQSDMRSKNIYEIRNKEK